MTGRCSACGEDVWLILHRGLMSLPVLSDWNSSNVVVTASTTAVAISAGTSHDRRATGFDGASCSLPKRQ